MFWLYFRIAAVGSAADHDVLLRLKVDLTTLG
jgi:hypothetical protein